MLRLLGSSSFIFVAAALAACATEAPSPATAAAALEGTDLPTALPGDVGVAVEPLVAMTNWVIDRPAVPIFSLLLSRHGRLAYELYTPGIERQDAHYLMSTSKSFTSAIVGAALDRGLLPGTDASVADLLPASVFPSAADVERFRGVTLKDAMGMSALDANEPPHDTSPDAVERGKEFAKAPNRVTFALSQALLPAPGTAYQYNDITPMLAGGAVQYATGKRLFDFATETLFGPMGFVHAEWMGEDATGLDLAAYGLRLRPIDMQKFGILFLNGGRWQGQQLLSEDWVRTSWTAYMNTTGPEPDGFEPDATQGFKNYGWYWWYRKDWGTEVHWTHGWRGQFIVCMPQLDAVFSMTADIETNDPAASEVTQLATLMKSFVLPALTSSASPPPPELEQELQDRLAAAHSGAPRFGPGTEARMIPSATPKARPVPFRP
jgi:CubicO group peptidase (beta-lactamase class C family)